MPIWLLRKSTKRREFKQVKMEILEAKIFYTKDKIRKVVVLGDCTSVGKPFSDVRALMATNKPCSGYEFIKPNETLSDDLIRRIADFGMETNPDNDFPNWKKQYNNKKQ